MDMSYIRTLLPLAALLLAPPRCLVCQARIARGTLCRYCFPSSDPPTNTAHCPICFGQLLQHPAASLCALCYRFPGPLSRQRYLWSYEGKARNLIVSMKYRPSLKLARFAGELLAARIAPLFDDDLDWDLIVPMPSSPGNYAHRLFNPAGVFAKSISKATGIPPITSALRHTNRSKPQASQLDRQRIRNALKSLERGRANLSGASVLLVDDVVTTGATGAVAARLLIQQGASRVELLSLARAATWEQYRSRIHRQILTLPCSPRTACGITGISSND